MDASFSRGKVEIGTVLAGFVLVQTLGYHIHFVGAILYLRMQRYRKHSSTSCWCSGRKRNGNGSIVQMLRRYRRWTPPLKAWWWRRRVYRMLILGWECLPPNLSEEEKCFGSTKGCCSKCPWPLIGTEKRNMEKSNASGNGDFLEVSGQVTENKHWKTLAWPQGFHPSCAVLWHAVLKWRKVFLSGQYAKQWKMPNPIAKHCKLPIEKNTFVSNRFQWLKTFSAFRGYVIF